MAHIGSVKKQVMEMVTNGYKRANRLRGFVMLMSKESGLPCTNTMVTVIN
jgi:hypothetical protein